MTNLTAEEIRLKFSSEDREKLEEKIDDIIHIVDGFSEEKMTYNIEWREYTRFDRHHCDITLTKIINEEYKHERQDNKD